MSFTSFIVQLGSANVGTKPPEGTLVYSSLGSSFVNEADGDYGFSVATNEDGTVIAAGVPGYDFIAEVDQGAVELHRYNGTTYSTEDYVYHVAGATGDNNKQGYSVDLDSSGTVLAFGAPNQVFGGEIYVSRYDGTSPWQTPATDLQRAVTESSAFYGIVTVISGDGNTIAASAPNQDNGLNTNGGIVYIWSWNGSSWTEQAQLYRSLTDSADFGEYGVGISEDGNTVAVGSRADDVDGGDSGSVYIFTRSGTTWTESYRISYPGTPVDNQYFGYRVALSDDGNTVVTNDLSNDEVHVFTRDNEAGTSWTHLQTLTSSGTPFTYGDALSLSKDGNVLVVGDSSEAVSPNSLVGVVYVYVKQGNTYTEHLRIPNPEVQQNSRFGYSVDISKDGSTLVVGAPYQHFTSTTTDFGKIFVYK